MMGQNIIWNMGTGKPSTMASNLGSRLVLVLVLDWYARVSPRTWEKVKCLLLSTSVTLFCDGFNLIGIQPPTTTLNRKQQ